VIVNISHNNRNCFAGQDEATERSWNKSTASFCRATETIAASVGE